MFQRTLVKDLRPIDDVFLRKTGKVVDDGLHEIFVNTVVDDGTDISELMSCFMKKEVKNPKFPALSSEVQRLKEESFRFHIEISFCSCSIYG